MFEANGSAVQVKRPHALKPQWWSPGALCIQLCDEVVGAAHTNETREDQRPGFRGQGRSRSQVTAVNGWIMLEQRWNSQKAMTWDSATSCTRWCHMGVGGPRQPCKKSSISLGSLHFGEHHPRIVSFKLCRLSADCGQIWPLLTGCS